MQLGVELDPAQTAAVTTPSTLVAVIAGAGSGKTRVLTSRITYRISAGTAAPQHTLALTFTREAAGELRRRLRRSGVRDHVEAGTFHGVALGLLRQRWADSNRRAPTVVADRDRLLAEVAGGLPMATLATECEWAAARGIRPDRYVNAARATGRRTASADRIATALADYEDLKRRRGVVDFDDLLATLSRELASDSAWADAVRWRFRHVLVDEAQDLNPIQYRLLEQLVGGRDDLYLVGDPAQAIYAFNGSDPSLLVDISERMPGIEIIALPTNHRSTPQIVAAGAAVLRVGGQARPGHSSRSDGQAVRIVAADDETHEAALVAQFVRSLDPGDARRGDVAVLARTNHQLSRLSTALVTSGVPVADQQLRPGSPLSAAISTATRLPSATRLREWAHDVLDSDADAADDTAERRVATTVLDFLREQPLGDGAGLRGWLATMRPFAGDDGGVELLTFHGAKGREWQTVVVTGVETGSVPHRSATTATAKAEEVRLLHVALTRASDRLVITWAGRRGGYRRQPSPLLAEVDAGEPVAVAPPADLVGLSPRRGSGRLERLTAWRAVTARAAMILPDEVCTDAHLHTIATADPMTPDDLAAVTGLGVLTATRLFPGIRTALDG